MSAKTLSNAVITFTDQTGASVSLPLADHVEIVKPVRVFDVTGGEPRECRDVVVFAGLPPITFTITDVRWFRERRGTRKQRRLAKVRRMQRHRKIDRRLDRLDEMQRRFLRDASYPQRYNPDVGP